MPGTAAAQEAGEQIAEAEGHLPPADLLAVLGTRTRLRTANVPSVRSLDSHLKTPCLLQEYSCSPNPR